MKELVKHILAVDISETAHFYNECCSGDCNVNYNGDYSGGNCGTNAKSGSNNCYYNLRSENEIDIFF
jgi:hypothetical protein